MDKERSIDNLNKYGLSINLKRPMSFSESHITDIDIFTKKSILNDFSPKLIIPLLSDQSQSNEKVKSIDTFEYRSNFNEKKRGRYTKR